MSLLEYLGRNPGCERLAEGAVHAVAPLLEDPDPDPLLAQLDQWAYHLAGRMPLPWNLHQAIDEINQFLFEELGLRGDRQTYDAPENAALPLVLQRRKGMPITLSILWIDLSRRLGLDAVGIALPGHFLSAIRTDIALLCFDPFHGGRAIGEEGAAELVERATRGRATFTPELLRPADDRAVLVRLVRNLQVRYERQSDWANALWTSTHLILLAPEDPDHHKTRARIHLHRSDPAAALQDLQQARALVQAPDPELDAWIAQLG